MDDPDRTASLMTPAKLAQAAPRAPASPAAWLDQMAAEAGHHHVRRAAELRCDLAAQGLGREVSPLAADLKSWRARLASMAAAAGESGASGLGVDGPQQSQRALQLRVQQIIADCAQLQRHEQSLADSLDALSAPLAAAAS